MTLASRRETYMDRWLGLMIGNSRLHWAYYRSVDSEQRILQTWDSPHLRAVETSGSGHSVKPWTQELPPELSHVLAESPPLPLRIASVVPDQTQYWSRYPNIRWITLKDIPLENLYATLGIDRALAALGAWHHHRTSVLVIDGGTALTLTGVGTNGALIGGAIMPGLRLQLRSLHHHTAALPDTALAQFPLSRWQTNTTDAIRSGVWHSLVAGVESFIEDWLATYPHSTIVFTGGDGQRLWKGRMDAIASQESATSIYDPHVIFKGMAAIDLSA